MKMTGQNYQRTISVDASPEDAYRAPTTGCEHWWTVGDNNFGRVGDRIKFTFPPNVSYWTFEAKKLEPNKTVELECVDAHHKITDRPDASETEWLGSRALWQIEPQGDKTTIHFVHKGLTPNLDCYDVCEAGWNLFFVDSLKAYLDSGVGKPHRPEQSS